MTGLDFKTWTVQPARFFALVASITMVLLFASKGAELQAQEIGRSDFQCRDGIYMRVRIVATQQAPHCRVYILMTTTNNQSISEKELNIQVFDLLGREIPVTNTLPKETPLPGTGNAGGTILYAPFDVLGGNLRVVEKVNVIYRGTTNHFNIFGETEQTS